MFNHFWLRYTESLDGSVLFYTADILASLQKIYPWPPPLCPFYIFPSLWLLSWCVSRKNLMHNTLLSIDTCAVLRHFGHILLFVTPWTVACQAPLSLGILQERILEWVAMPSSRGIFLTEVSHIAGRFFTIWATREAYRHINRKKNLWWVFGTVDNFQTEVREIPHGSF